MRPSKKTMCGNKFLLWDAIGSALGLAYSVISLTKGELWISMSSHPVTPESDPVHFWLMVGFLSMLSTHGIVTILYCLVKRTWSSIKDQQT